MITQVGVAVEWDSGGNAVSTVGPVAVPTGAAADDVLEWRASGNLNSLPATPAGWTLVQSVTGTAQTMCVYLLRRQAGDPSSYSMAVGGAGRWVSEMTAWRGVDTTTPLDVVTPAGSINSTGLATPPSITTATAGARVVMAFHATIAKGTSEVFTSSTNTTKLGRSYSNSPVSTGAVGATFAADLPAAAGAFTPNLTSDLVPTRSSVITLALRPAPELPTVTPFRGWGQPAVLV